MLKNLKRVKMPGLFCAQNLRHSKTEVQCFLRGETFQNKKCQTFFECFITSLWNCFFRTWCATAGMWMETAELWDRCSRVL